MYNETSENLDKIIITNDGYYQYERLLKAMKEGYIKVDERSFDELLEFAVEFGGLINFYNLNNEIEGDWAPFFLKDESIILGSIINCNLSDLEMKYRNTEYLAGDSNDTDEKSNLLKELFAKIVYIARKIDLWLKVVKLASSFEFDLHIENQLEACIQNGLGECLMKLHSYDKGAGMPNSLEIAIGLNYDNFTNVWAVYDVQPESSIYFGNTINEKINNSLPHLNSIFCTFLYEISHLKNSLQSLYCKSLENDYHRPDTALYITFVRLFSYAQSSVNSYIEKYRDFYYEDILRETRQGPISDNVYLCFEADPKYAYRPVVIKNGTLFSAGDDKKGKEILFSLDRDLFVNSAVIAKQRTIYQKITSLYEEVEIFVSGKLVYNRVSPEIMLTHVFTGDHVPEDKEGKSSKFPLPALGSDVVVKSKDYVNNNAMIGFAVASKCLELSGGERTVSFRMFHSDNYVAKLDNTLAILSCETGQERAEIYKKCLLSAFTILFSSKTKWVKLKVPYTVSLIEGVANNDFGIKIYKGFQIDFSLSSAAPPIVNFDPVKSGTGDKAKHKDSKTEPIDIQSCNPVPQLPTVKFYLNNEPLTFSKMEKCKMIRTYPLTVLNDFELTQIKINVSVNGFNNISLSNNYDKFQPNKPFNPFGPVPANGSYFQIESDELFAKSVTELNVKMNWLDLPPYKDGFKGYYKDYVLGIDGKKKSDLFNNAVFKCKFSVIDPNKWDLQNSGNKNKYYLFKEADSNGKSGVVPDASKESGSKEQKGTILNVFKEAGAKGNRGTGSTVQIDNLSVSSEFKLTNFVKLKKKEQSYNIEKKSSIKLELSDPPYGFGAGLFALNAQYVALVNLEKLTPSWHSFFSTKSKSSLILKKGGIMNNPNPPYSPVIKNISVSYKALEELTFDQSQSDSILFFNLHPFGGWEQINSIKEKHNNESVGDCCENPKHTGNDQEKLLDVSKNTDVVLGKPKKDDTENVQTDFVHLLPQFESNGCLMIGFDHVESPQILTLLFRFMNNSEIIMDGEPGAVRWSYLSGNKWKDVESANILFDFTNGLQNNGIIAFNLPSWENGSSTILEPSYWWLKASSNDNIKAFPKIINIWINVGTASWLKNDASGKRLKTPLPELKIKTIPKEVKGVSKVTQPYKSFGGKPEETQLDMLIRVGERLSNKDRAIMPKDYERLILQRFPMIYMTKCLPTRTVSNCNMAGNVLVVVVRGPDVSENIDPLTPMANNQLLAEIELYLRKRVSPFIKLYVVNPVYCKIKVTVSVGFVGGNGAGAYAEKLNDEIVSNLSPWFFDDKRARNKSSYFLKSSISDFIQNCNYVDFMTSLTLSYDPKPINDPNAWCFCTSAEKHDITIVYENTCV